LGRCLDTRSGSYTSGESRRGDVGCPSPESDTHERAARAQLPLCIGRYEGTKFFLGRRAYPQWLSALVTPVTTAPQYVCGAATLGWAPVHRKQVRTRDRLSTAPGPGKRKKNEKNPLTGVVCLLTKGVLIRVRPGLAPNFLRAAPLVLLPVVLPYTVRWRVVLRAPGGVLARRLCKNTFVFLSVKASCSPPNRSREF
jgi:hypothetical protein